MGEMTRTIVRLPPVEDPETGTVYESDGERLTLTYRCDCGTELEGTAVLYDKWTNDFRLRVIDEVAEVLREECCG